MTYAVRINDLSAMRAEEREGVLKQLAKDAAALPNGQRDSVLAKVRSFEERYEFSSASLLERLKSGSQRETAEIAEWLFCLKLLSLGR